MNEELKETLQDKLIIFFMEKYPWTTDLEAMNFLKQLRSDHCIDVTKQEMVELLVETLSSDLEARVKNLRTAFTGRW